MRKSAMVVNAVIAFQKGYRVHDDGVVYAPTGAPRRVSGATPLLTISTGNGKHGVLKVSHLAAYQRYGEKALAPGVEVRHLNNDATDNRPSNTAYGTHAQNMQDMPAERRREKAKYAASFVRRLSDEEAKQLRRDRAAGVKYTDLMKKYGCAKSTISYIVNEVTYRDA